MGLDLAPGWRTIAASVAGVSHGTAGQPCADACAARLVGGGLLVAIAADGAGTAERAAQGARLACTTVLELAEERAGGPGLAGFDHDEGVRWVEVVRGRLDEAAASAQVDRREFSCTLLVALVDPRRAVFLQIGDGAIVYGRADGRYLPAFWPQTGEYANTTWFVTDADAAARLQTAAGRGRA